MTDEKATIKRLKTHCTKHGLRIEERYLNTGFVYFGDESRVFWTYNPRTDEIDLSQGWGWPTDAETKAIMQALALRLSLSVKAPA